MVSRSSSSKFSVPREKPSTPSEGASIVRLYISITSPSHNSTARSIAFCPPPSLPATRQFLVVRRPPPDLAAGRPPPPPLPLDLLLRDHGQDPGLRRRAH